MTRINVVPVETLVDKHLVAEWRELPRVFGLVHRAKDTKWRQRQPAAYTMGTGHVTFFYDKLGYLAKRHEQLTAEMKRRGFNLKFKTPLREEWAGKIAPEYWQDYKPNAAALSVSQSRINERLKEMLSRR